MALAATEEEDDDDYEWGGKSSCKDEGTTETSPADAAADDGADAAADATMAQPREYAAASPSTDFIPFAPSG